MKKIIRYGSHYLNSEDIKRVTRSLNSNSITQGLEIKNYENLLCKYFGSKYAVALSSGTAALHLGIKSFRLKKGLKVITSPITFIATASSILMNDFLNIYKLHEIYQFQNSYHQQNTILLLMIFSFLKPKQYQGLSVHNPLQ